MLRLLIYFISVNYGAASGEKLIFSRGEKRRLAGRRYAHTKQAIWIAIITGILSAITEAIPDSED
ncbi:hypothetical protein CJ240_06875 [Varibaculum cambriense]|uniref:Uncharacterized protein n=1 Tax=Varibaculum cambriense TaxID=184870 RepID=A0ABX4USZ3_9ACTO|nr:hypothetical protein CJ240_06875 [Varibaculum cambriense]